MKKNSKNSYDYLIIGQGLAGSVLSHLLIMQGKKVLVLNSYDPRASSYIACGIFSPIAGQRIAKIWHAEETSALIFDFYKNLESILGVNFFHPMPYIKLLIDDELKDFAARRCKDPSYQGFFESYAYTLNKQEVPALEIKNTGWVHTSLLLDTYRAYLMRIDSYREERYDESVCMVQPEGITYKDVHAEHLIFCNGLAVNQNRFFSDVRFYPTKGEILTVRMPAPQDVIICGNVFVLPIGNNLFHVGATFSRTYEDLLPSQAGKDWLCQELEKIIDVPYEIIDHRVGVRPTTPGHRPIYRWHDTYKNVAVFSGFGAKGVSYIPYCAQELLRNHTQI